MALKNSINSLSRMRKNILKNRQNLEKFKIRTHIFIVAKKNIPTRDAIYQTVK